MKELKDIENALKQEAGANSIDSDLLGAGANVEADEKARNSWTAVLDRKYAWALTIGCGLVLFQQITGQPSVLYYATNIFKSAGFGGSAALQSVLVSVSKLIFTLLTVWRVDRYGRKALLYVGIIMMTVSLALIGLAFYQQTCMVDLPVRDCPSDQLVLPDPWGIVTLSSLMVYVGGYQVGFGPIAWLMISEIFPLNVRGAALSIAAVTNFGSNLLVAFFFQGIMNALGSAATFWLYCGLCVVSLVFVKMVVIETKGLSLEEIERLLIKKAPVPAGYEPLLA